MVQKIVAQRAKEELFRQLMLEALNLLDFTAHSLILELLTQSRNFIQQALVNTLLPAASALR